MQGTLMDGDEPLDQFVASASDPIQWAFYAGVRLMGARRASLLLSDGAELRMEASVGIDPAIVPTVHIPIGHGIAGIVAERGVTLFGEAADARFISVPLETPRGVVGVLNLSNREGLTDFDDAAVAAARSLASHISYLLTHETNAGLGSPTSLVSRYGFFQILERELARSSRTGSSLAVIVINLVGLRARTGERRTQDALRQIESALVRSIRQYDSVSRYDDDCFAILLPDCGPSAAQVTARLKQMVERILGSVDIRLPVRVGLVHSPVDGLNGRQLLEVVHERLVEDVG